MVFNKTFLYGPPMANHDGSGGGGGGASKITAATVEATKKAVAGLESAMASYMERVKAAQLPHVKLLDTVNKIRDANEKLVKSGGTFYQNFAPGGEYNRSLQETIRLSQDFFGNANAGLAAIEGLALGMKSFVGVSAEVQTSLAKSTMYMGELGFNIESVAKALNNQAMAFGTSEKDLQKYAATMSKLSNALFINPTELMADFDHAQQNFAYNAEHTLDVFVRLQEQSRKSGLEFGTMATSFGEGMDTFEGVSGLAGRLNAILGSSVFNPMQLLGMDEAERAAAIRKGIQDSPILGGKDINELSKFELKSIASTLKMSVLDTRKYLTGQGDVRKQFQDTLDKRMGPEGVEGLTGLADTNSEIVRMKDTLRNLRHETENFYIDSMKKAALVTDEAMGAAAKKIGAGGIDKRDYNTIFKLMMRVNAGLIEAGHGPGGLGRLSPEDQAMLAQFSQNRAHSRGSVGIPGARSARGAEPAIASAGLVSGRPGVLSLVSALFDTGMPDEQLPDWYPDFLKDDLGIPKTRKKGAARKSPVNTGRGYVPAEGDDEVDEMLWHLDNANAKNQDDFTEGFKDLFTAAFTALASDDAYINQLASSAAKKVIPVG